MMTPEASIPGPAPIDESALRAYLSDELPPDQMARVEKALRESATLRARLEDVRADREDFQLHSLGAIWRRSRLTCPTRQQLGSYVLDALDPELGAYFQFHLEVVECPICQANLSDLEAQSRSNSGSDGSRTRHQRILKSSEHLLGDEA
nr:hypothetical protein [Planctomyces sp. SH-PL62]